MPAQGNRTIRLIHAAVSNRALAQDAVAAFRARRQAHLQAARDNVAAIAEENGHVLGPWRPDDVVGELTQCRACGEGARLDVVQATARLTAGLDAPCIASSGGGGDLPCHAGVPSATAS